MTNETKELFDAPWTVADDKDEQGRYMVLDNKMACVSKESTLKDANRIARLPELYDALVYFVHRSCSSANIDRCPNQGTMWVGCRDCSLMPYIELLRKVRRGSEVEPCS